MQDVQRFPLDMLGRLITEAEWQSTICKVADAYGWSWYHTVFSVRSKRGYPDLTLWHVERKQVFWVEVKKETGKTTINQDRIIGGLRAADQEVHIWRPNDWPEVVERLSFGRARAA